jgi:hypothetical protein
VGKHRNKRRARIERPAAGTETWRRSTQHGHFGGHFAPSSHGARRPRGGRGGRGPDGYTIPVIEPWGCLSTRHS